MKNYLVIILSFMALAVQAQTDVDALRFSQTMQGGTARNIGSGSGMGAIGADFGAVSNNPAALGFNRNSEFVVSPAMRFNNTSMKLDTTFSDMRAVFHVNSIGVIIAKNHEERDWKTNNIVFGYQQVANFNRQFSFSGITRGSMINSWVSRAQGTSYANLDPFNEKLAYDAYLIDNTNSTSATDYYGVLNNNSITAKQDMTTEKGNIGDMYFAWAGNYLNKVYLGGSFAVSFLTYKSQRVYSESDPANLSTTFESMSYTYNLATTGTGVKGNIGVVIRPVNSLRVGVAIHTPTVYYMHDEYNANIQSVVYYAQGSATPQRTESNVNSPTGTYNYRLVTPVSMTSSIGAIVGKSGFVTMEADWVPYGSSRFSFDNAPTQETAVNNSIQNKYQSAFNVRVGGEYAIKNLRLRAGYGYYGSPFTNNVTAKPNDRQAVSGGIGFRANEFFCDLACNYTTNQFTYSPFSGAGTTSSASGDSHILDMTITFGWRF